MSDQSDNRALPAPTSAQIDRLAAHWSRPSVVALVYLVLTCVATWPLVRLMHREIAGDLGDPIFNCWVLLWTGGQVLSFLHGDFSALSRYWHGNIFYPSPLTIAYSEHLAPQMLQILPILGITGNIVLCYNLLILATFVLSGLGMYLLVRELTGSALAGLLAGAAFAFTPYRVDQYPHLEVLSSQWMPFALYGLRRFFVTGRWRPLLCGATALAVQGLSCSYYLAYFPPFVIAYCLYELISRRKIGDTRTWMQLVAAGGLAAAIVAPFVATYFRVRHSMDLGVRSLDAIQFYSADTHAYATITRNSRLLGNIVSARPRIEGQGFPGFTTLAFAVIAAIGAAAAGVAAARRTPSSSAWRLGVAVALWVVGLFILSALVVVLVEGRFVFAGAGVIVVMTNALTLIERLGVVFAVLLLVSPAARRFARGESTSDVAFFWWAAIAAAWMSLGPMMHADGRPVGAGLYDVFYSWVPGFNGLRVAALNFMLVVCFLSVAAGLGAAWLLKRAPKIGRAIVAVGIAGIMAESWSVPTDTNLTSELPGYPPLPNQIHIGADLPPLYQFVKAMPAGTVLLEFPYSESEFNRWSEFYAGYHRKPIVNGYSGYAPASYTRLLGALTGAPHGAEAWRAVQASGATHVVVHEGDYAAGQGAAVSAWLRESGAREVAAFGTDRLFAVRQP